MAVYNIRIVNSNGSATTEAIGSYDTHVLISAESGLTLASKLTSLTNQINTNTANIAKRPIYSVATQTANGLMSATDKVKLDSLSQQGYTLPTASASTLGGVKIGTGAGLAINTDGLVTNTGVRSVTQGTINGSLTVNTNGTSVDVKIQGWDSISWTANSALATNLTWCSNNKSTLETLVGNVNNYVKVGTASSLAATTTVINSSDPMGMLRNIQYLSEENDVGVGYQMTESDNGLLICVYEE